MDDTAVSVTPDFEVEVRGVKGSCPAGETWAGKGTSKKEIPVLSCEGPCVRGDIARRVANRMARKKRYRRCCPQEAVFVPHSAMARWIRSADQVVMIDGCFLKCGGRTLKGIVEPERLTHFDILPMYNKYTNVFAMDDVPRKKRTGTARKVARKVLAELEKTASVVA